MIDLSSLLNDYLIDEVEFLNDEGIELIQLYNDALQLNPISQKNIINAIDFYIKNSPESKSLKEYYEEGMSFEDFFCLVRNAPSLCRPEEEFRKPAVELLNNFFNSRNSLEEIKKKAEGVSINTSVSGSYISISFVSTCLKKELNKFCKVDSEHAKSFYDDYIRMALKIYYNLKITDYIEKYIPQFKCKYNILDLYLGEVNNVRNQPDNLLCKISLRISPSRINPETIEKINDMILYLMN